MAVKDKASTAEDKLQKYNAPVVVGEATDPISFVTISWLSKMVWVGGKRPLQYEDLPLIPERSRANVVAHILDRFNANVEEYLKAGSPADKKPRLFPDIWRFLGVSYLFAVFLDCVHVVFQTTQPAVMGAIIAYLQNGESNIFLKSPIGLALLYFSMTFFGLIFRQTTQQMFRRMTYGIRSTIVTALYAKSLKLSNKASVEFSKGRILQMINSDVEEISMAVQNTHAVVMVPFQLAFSFYYLGNLFGANLYPVGIVAGIFLAIVPGLIYLFVTQQGKYQKAGDKRLATLREVFEGIKMVKLRGQETFFIKTLTDVRNAQLSAIAAMTFGMFFFMNLATLVPFSMMIGTFVVYANNVKSIDPVVIFPASQYFFNVFEPITALPLVFFGLGQTLVSWNRVKNFLLAEESEFTSLPLDPNSNEAIRVVDASFKWVPVKKDDEDKKGMMGGKNKDKNAKKAKKNDVAVAPEGEKSSENPIDAAEAAEESAPLFKNLNFTIPARKLTAIVGTVGSGKSSLFSAIIGEMTHLEGKVEVHGSVALCLQQPSLWSMNVRDNIIFGSELDEKKLDETIRACGLEVDIKQFQNGLDTEIGEKGIALSGGQKARVALARAVYSDADVFLLDDPLAALDAHVGKHVFDECIKTHLEGKTRVLITHQLHVLPNVDHIIVLEKGVVVEQGSYSELVNGPEDGRLRDMLKNHVFEDDDSAKGKVVKKGAKIEEATGSAEDLIQDEDRQTGAVDKKYVLNYIKEFGGWGVVVVILFGTLMYAVATYIQALFMTYWSQDSYAGNTRWGLQSKDYITVYTGIVIFTFLSSALQTGFILRAAFVSAKNYHIKAIAGLMRAPMSWFDSQPLGRIINRLTKDVGNLDFMLGGNIFAFFMVLSQSLASMAQVITGTLYTLIFIAVLAIVSFFLLEFYRSTQRELRRLIQINNSPLTAYISECIGSTTTIRAFQAKDRSIVKQRQLTDRALMPEWTNLNVYNWFSLRVEGCLAILVFFIVMYSVLVKLDPAIVGLALTGVSQLGQTFFGCITAFSRVESGFVSAERLDMYCNSLESEAPTHRDSDPEESAWPKQGNVSISQLEVKYAAKFDPVIRDLSVEIKGGEKIGVVGRTGSGKSTLMIALFRIVEPTKGSVLIDGIDVSQLGLHTLRTRLQIIAQEPVLFTGTIRKNLDIEGKFADQDLWEALELVGLKEYVAELPEKLDAPVTERGENLSVGQRQLMMLASAICHKPKILVMDEASSSVDQAADLLIQSSIRTHFKNTTVISIAHRVNTIADFDRIMVLDAGRLVEFDSPINLLNREDSLFKSLVDATGAANAQVVRTIAEKHFD